MMMILDCLCFDLWRCGLDQVELEFGLGLFLGLI
jgi:hypothetical protein